MWECEKGHPNPDNYSEMEGPPELPFCECVWRNPENLRSLLKIFWRAFRIRWMEAHRE